MNINDVINIKKGSDSIVKIMKGSTLVWPVNLVPVTNYVRKLYGRYDNSTVYGDHFGQNVKINNGIIAVLDPQLWSDLPDPGHASEISLYDTNGNWIRNIYEDYDVEDRQNDFVYPTFALNATHVGAGHDKNDGQYFLWDINGNLVQKIQRPVTFTGVGFAQSASMNSTRLFVGGYGNTTDQAVYVYNMAGAYLDKIDNPGIGVYFGSTIYANDSYVMINANDGVHVYNASTYAFIRTFSSASNTYGYSMYQRGNYFYIGDYASTENGQPSAGSVNIYNVSDGSLVTKITDPVPSENGNFGYSISADSNYLIIGEPSRYNTTTGTEGWFFVYTTAGTFQAEVRPSDLVDSGATSTYFGNELDIESGNIIVGAWNDEAGDPDDLANTQYAGSAYIFNVGTLILPD